MIIQFKRWLSPPVFADDEIKTWRASLLNTGLIISAVMALVVMLAEVLGGHTPGLVIGLTIIALSVSIVAYYWLRHGRIWLAGLGLLTFGTAGITASVATLGTVQTPLTAFYLGIVIGAGLLFDLAGILTATILTSLIVFGLILAQNAGSLPQPDYTVTITQWLMYTALFGLMGALTFMTLRSTRMALHRANREIAERRQAEAALRESEQRYRAIFDGVRDAILVEAPDGRLLDVNAEACKLYGDTRENLLRKPVAALVAPEQLIITAAHVEQPEPIGLLHETVNVRANGDRFPAEINCCVTTINGERVLLVVVRDITERQRADEALRWSEELYHSLVETLPLSIFRKDATGRFTFANSLYARIEGRPLSEILGKTDYDLHPRELAEKYIADDQRCMAAGEVFKTLEEHQPLGGAKTYVQVVKTPLYDAAGQASGIQGAFWDVTDHMRVAEALRDMNATLEQRVAERTHALTEAHARLAELDQLKDEFIGRISHELRTPLANVKLYLSLLERGKPDKRTDYLHTLHEQTERLNQLIDDLLDVAHLNVRATEIQRETFDVNVLLHDLVADRAAAAERRGLTLGVTAPLDQSQLTTDRTLLRQALFHLIANALAYTPAGGAISIGAAWGAGPQPGSDRAWVAIEVHDTGPGISAKDLPHIFQPFYRGEAAANYRTPGAGVGLSIAKQLIEQLGGHIAVDSQPGQGATFSLWLKVS